ncbi:MAG: hypothetical protein R3Y21_04685 [Mycoplasmatota bacterium]
MANYTYKQNTLTMFIYILENKEIDFKTYTELYGIQRTNKNQDQQSPDIKLFNYMLKLVNQIIIDLKINTTIYTTTVDKTTYHHYQFTKPKITFDIIDITNEQKSKYELIILYLLLINNQYITLSTLKQTFPNINKIKFIKLRKELQEVIIEDLEKNPITKSYQLILEEE